MSSMTLEYPEGRLADNPPPILLPKFKFAISLMEEEGETERKEQGEADRDVKVEVLYEFVRRVSRRD